MTKRFTVAVWFVSVLFALPAMANPFQDGWTLDSRRSMLVLTHIKNGDVVENSAFAALRGGIDADGNATLRILLDSIDTGLDLRNVRMRFLLFESFQNPEAIATLRLDPSSVASLPINRIETLTLPYTLNLHGVRKEDQALVNVMLLYDDEVVVSTMTPIAISAGDFGLMKGVGKLEEAAEVSITPTATVTFNLVFERRAPQPATVAVGSTPPAAVGAAAPVPAKVALEPQMLKSDECAGRFEILSQTDAITFGAGSSTLRPSSAPVLEEVTDIINRCEDLSLRIAGHTDSDGDAEFNRRLSELRAKSVKAFLVGLGVDPARIEAVGHGEAQPLVPNDSAQNKARNRRIEFETLS